jgi:hypothetical protein
MAPEQPSSQKRPVTSRARESWSDLSRAGKWVVAVVLASAIGAPVGALSTKLLIPDDGSENSATSTEEQPKPLFNDPFSTTGEKRYKNDADGYGTAQYTGDGAYQIHAERAMGRWGVLAWPGLEAENVEITVKAHRVDGTATDGFGYGIFCRGDGQANLYAFTIWKNHATIEKRTTEGQAFDPPTDARITADAEGDAEKELRAVCTTSNGGNGVDLEFWVDGERILAQTDDDDPLPSGTYGMYAALGQSHGNLGDTLDVEFDDFVVNPASTPST